MEQKETFQTKASEMHCLASARKVNQNFQCNTMEISMTMHPTDTASESAMKTST